MKLDSGLPLSIFADGSCRANGEGAGGWGIREVTPADYPRICELSNLTMVEPVTVQILKERDANWTGAGMRHRLVAVSPPPDPLPICGAQGIPENGEGEVLAYGGIFRWPGMPKHNSFLTIHVAPAHRRKGIGSALLAELGARAIRDGIVQATATTRDDRPMGQEFMKKHGFDFKQHLLDSVLDFADFEFRLFEPLVRHLCQKDIELVDYSSFRDCEENRRAVHAIHNECDADTPGIEEWGLSEFEDFEGDTFKSSRHDPTGLVLAIANSDFYSHALIAEKGELIGLSWVGPVQDGIWGTHFSGVRKAFRGQGIGVAMKAVALSNAKALGATICRAQNDTRNEPMLAINSKLGFVPQFGWIYMTRSI